MAQKLQQKLLKKNEQHTDFCFIKVYDCLYLIIITQNNQLAIHCIDGDLNQFKDNEIMAENNDIPDNLTTNCIIDSIKIDYKSKSKQILKCPSVCPLSQYLFIPKYMKQKKTKDRITWIMYWIYT